MERSAFQPLVLASASPRRLELVSLLGIPFEVIPSRAEENDVTGSGKERVRVLARRKGEEVAARLPGRTVLAADTLVCVENEVLMYFRSQRKSASDVSLSEYIETGKDGNALSLMDVICSDEDLFDDLSGREMQLKLRQAVTSCLTQRERRIITLRYGLGGTVPMTQREIAAECGISRSYVSRIEKKALQKLEQALAEFQQ